MSKFVVNPAVTETKVVEISPATYTLTLNAKEAQVIKTLVGNVSGSPIASEFRRVADEIYNGMTGVVSSRLRDSFIKAPEGNL